jgi:hypothetical protein
MDENQQIIPQSFVALFVDPGRVKPRESRAVIAERYDYCEDLAQMLSETAQTKLWELKVAESDVLERIEAGLSGTEAGLDEAEARWVATRLREILGWGPDR